MRVRRRVADPVWSRAHTVLLVAFALIVLGDRANAQVPSLPKVQDLAIAAGTGTPLDSSDFAGARSMPTLSIELAFLVSPSLSDWEKCVEAGAERPAKPQPTPTTEITTTTTTGGVATTETKLERRETWSETYGEDRARDVTETVTVTSGGATAKTETKVEYTARRRCSPWSVQAFTGYQFMRLHHSIERTMDADRSYVAMGQVKELYFGVTVQRDVSEGLSVYLAGNVRFPSFHSGRTFNDQGKAYQLTGDALGAGVALGLMLNDYVFVEAGLTARYWPSLGLADGSGTIPPELPRTAWLNTASIAVGATIPFLDR